MSIPAFSVRLARRDELARILSVQREAFSRVSVEQGIHPGNLPPLAESLDDLVALQEGGTRFFVLVADDMIIGCVRARQTDKRVEFGRLVVSKDHMRRGVATYLMAAAEADFPDAQVFELFTGADAYAALSLYQRAGYSVVRGDTVHGVPLVWLEKTREFTP